MQAILAVTVPFFALVACGYLAARQHALPEAAIPGLNAFVLFFALPCLLFRFGMGTPVLDLLNPAMLLAYLACAGITVAITVRFSRAGGLNLKDSAFGALVAAFPNTGFMGVPLLVALLGAGAAGPVICTVLADMFVTSSLCIALAQTHDASGQGRRAAVAKALRGALSNPLPWSIALGALCSAAGWRTSGPVDVVIRMLADAASPVALFTIGAVLWRAGAQAQRLGSRTPLRHVLPVALVKLLMHPALVLGAGLAARAMGAPLTGFHLMVLTLAAALPSASSVSLLAERFGADNGRIARIIMSSTVIGFASFSAWAWGLRTLAPGWAGG